MSDRRFHWKREYTDTCVAIGPNLRWTEDDYEDLNQAYPEVFLGYNVLLTTANRLDLSRALLGRRISKIVVFTGVYTSQQYSNLHLVGGSYVYLQPECKYEEWHVHRVRGIWRVR